MTEYHKYNKDEYREQFIDLYKQVTLNIIKQCFPSYVVWGVEYVPHTNTHTNSLK